MKILKFGLRFWITAASVLSFVGGWIMLVHAPKPYQLFQQTTVQVLEPLPPLSDFGTGKNIQAQSLFNVQPRNRSSFFRTGGS